MSGPRPRHFTTPIEYRVGRSLGPGDRQRDREFVAYYRGDEVYCRGCFPRGEDSDEFERMDINPELNEFDFLPVCLVCGREFREYVLVDPYTALATLVDDGDYDPEGDFRE